MSASPSNEGNASAPVSARPGRSTLPDGASDAPGHATGLQNSLFVQLLRRGSPYLSGYRKQGRSQMLKITNKSRRLFWLLPVALVAAGAVGVAAKMQPPSDLDLSLSKPTENGLYVGTLEPGATPLSVGPIHSWTVAITTADGKPVDHAAITVDGGMPQHGHGLPTRPQVTRELGQGRYLIEGMKFNMPGWWTIELDIDGPSGHDSATFNVTL